VIGLRLGSLLVWIVYEVGITEIQYNVPIFNVFVSDYL